MQKQSLLLKFAVICSISSTILSCQSLSQWFLEATSEIQEDGFGRRASLVITQLSEQLRNDLDQ
ncbi:MAG: hypothetical protein AAFY67_20800, partial [Cyanobacteria bacterium J06642_9]